MEAVAAAMESIKGFGKATQHFALDLVHWRENSHRRNPIEILKRLQREAFSDIMKLRDRQEKVERMLTFYKTSRGSPFKSYSTDVRGEIDASGALLLIDNVDQQQYDAVQRAGIRTGIKSRLVFQTTIRQKDTLVAEIMGSETEQSDISGSPLSLTKVLYAANVSDWFSAVAIPMGAQCKDVGVDTSYCHQEKGLTDYSGFGPPLLNEHNGSAFGIMVREKKVVASLAQFISGLGRQPSSSGTTRCFSTFGQVVCQLSNCTKISLLGLLKVPKLSTQSVHFGSMASPVGFMRRSEYLETPVEGDGPHTETNWGKNEMAGSIALTLESELDDSTRLGGWIEMKKSNPRHIQWAVRMSDAPEDEIGWGLSLGGLVQSPRKLDHFQAEAFLNFNFGKRVRMQPALLYVMDGSTQFPAVMFRSSWSL